MIKAVIFDVFETLVTHYRSPKYFGEDIAKDLGLTEERFREIWDQTEHDRSIGLRTFENVIAEIMKKNGIYSETLLSKVLNKRSAAKVEVFMHLHEEILPMLETLKRRGIKMGLISNCFSEEVFAIKKSILYPYFDAAMLSFEQGIMKPDKEIFYRCQKKLNVSAEDCLYVGDGGSKELETATELGMKAVQATWYFEDNERANPKRKPQFPALVSPMEVLQHLTFFSVLFGTREPLRFHEVVRDDVSFDMRMKIRGSVGIYGFDAERFFEAEDITKKIREVLPSILQTGLTNWAEEKSVLQSDLNAVFSSMIEKGLSSIGIMVKTESVAWQLTEDSQELYKTAVSQLAQSSSSQTQEKPKRAEGKTKREEIREFYEKNMYGTWREGEKVSYEFLGEDPKAKEKRVGFPNPFEVIGGELVKIKVETQGRKAEFVVHAYLPKEEDRRQYPKGSPFIICLHPIQPKDYLLSQGYALFFMEGHQIASDDVKHEGAFYELYPYGKKGEEQTGVLMAWAWGASKVLDAVYAGIDKAFSLDAEASMVTGVSRCGKATAVCGAFDQRFRMTIPACSGAGGLALYNFVSEGKTYDLRKAGAPAEYTYGKNEPLDCLQSDAERGWFNDAFLQYKTPAEIPLEQENLPILAMSKNRYYFIIAAYTGEDWVNAPAMWECYKKANEAYEKEGLSDHLAVHFHQVGHAVIQEDAELLVKYFNHMYYGMETGLQMEELKTTLFAGQEYGNAPILRLRPYKKSDSQLIAKWAGKDEVIYYRWSAGMFGDFPLVADKLNDVYTYQNGFCKEEDNFYPMIAFDETGVVGHFIMRYIGDHETIRFGWVIVDDTKRGFGYGKRMLELGLKYAFEILKAKKVTIGVYENNAPAYACYKSLGFTEVAQDQPRTFDYKDEKWKVIELEKTK
ncbi:MAG: GNAT family N-acetyltransferase [Lachnospiraceae bacterium]|nr:GNAT family N-acetyltransferase [Lachnospiraceae bacterium]